MSIRHLRACAFLFLFLVVVVGASVTAQAQDQNYNEDWIAPAAVPPAVRRSAEKAVVGVRFEATYRGPDLAYRFVGLRPDKKSVSVKVAEDGRLISVRTWTSILLSKVPRAVLTALQTEVLDNPQMTGFRPSKATSVELFRAEKNKTETFFELFGTRGDLVPARAEVTAVAVVRRAEIILNRPIEHERRQTIATASIPLAARQKVLEASPGSTFTKGVYSIERGGRTMITAFGLDKTGRAVEVLVEIKEEPKAKAQFSVLSITTAIKPDEVPPEAQAKLQGGLATDDDLKGFQATEAQRIFKPWDASENIDYIVSGRNAKGKRMRVMIDHNEHVQSWEDRDAGAAEGSSTPVAGGPVAARKFAVLTARFGIDDRWVDLTEQVKAKVAGCRLDWEPVDLPDPAYGTNKVLAVVYSADGRVGLSVCRADRPFALPPPDDDKASRAEVPPKGFAVLSARYGIFDNWSDVTDALRGRVTGDRLEVASPSTDLPDPAKGIHKTFVVAYSIDGEVGLRGSRDDRPLALPEGRPTTEASTETWKVELPVPMTAGAVGFSGDGKLVFLGGEDGVVRWLDAADGRELGRLEDTGEGRVDALAVSPAGAILVARPGRPVRLWPSRTSKQPIALGDYKEPITTLAISPKGGQAATGSWDKSARLWDLKTGRQVRQFLGNEAVVMGVGFTADGLRLVTTSWDGTARLWDAATGAQKFEYEGDNGQLGKVCVSRDGKLALFVSDRGSLITWDLATGKIVTRVVAPACAGWALALSPDRRWMADAEQNAAVLRDVDTLKVAARLERHVAQVKVLAFSPDSRSLLTGADDKVIRLWKLPEPTR